MPYQEFSWIVPVHRPGKGADTGYLSTGHQKYIFFSEVNGYLHVDKRTSTPLIWCIKSGHDTQYISFSQKGRNMAVQLLGNYLNLPGLLGKRATFLPPAIQHICNYVFLFGYPNTNIMVSATWNNFVSDLNEEEQRHFYLIWTNYDFCCFFQTQKWFEYSANLILTQICCLSNHYWWDFEQLHGWQVHG